VSLRNWSGRQVVAISVGWIILVWAYGLWREFGTGTISRLRGSNIEGFVVVSDRPSLTLTLLASFVPPLILLLLSGRSGKQRN
jgi:hypothetical protein